MKQRTIHHSSRLFWVLAFALSWGNFAASSKWPDFPFLYPYGPLLAALIVSTASGTLRDFLGRCLRWRVGWQWYAAAVAVPAAIGLLTVFLTHQLGRGATPGAGAGGWASLLLIWPMAVVDAPLGEDTGWRGFALPRFSRRRSRLANSLILGALIAAWHAPLALGEPAIAAPYLLATVASAVVTNWVYYGARESALLAILYHSVANTFGIYFTSQSSGPALVTYFWALAAVNWLAAALAGKAMTNGE